MYWNPLEEVLETAKLGKSVSRKFKETGMLLLADKRLVNCIGVLPDLLLLFSELKFPIVVDVALGEIVSF